MEVERKKVGLLNDIYAYIGRQSDDDNMESFKEQIKKYVNLLNKIIDSDFKKLNNKELYNLLCNIYYISFDIDDYLTVLSSDIKYKSFYELPTTMTFNSMAYEGHGKSFDWWDQLYQIYYLVAASEKFKFDYNKIYTKDEIRKMLLDKSILIVKEITEPIDEVLDFKEENYESLSIVNLDNDDISRYIVSNNYLFNRLVRKRFTKRVVLKDVKRIIDSLNNDINELFAMSHSEDSIYLNTAKMCKEWFELSDVNREYLGIQKRLNNK